MRQSLSQRSPRAVGTATALVATACIALISATFAFIGTAGAQATGSISNFTWFDTNGNGIQDGEAGLGGVTINLYNDNDGAPGTLLDTTTSNGIGNYAFGDLADGTYHVEFIAPIGYMLTAANQGLDNADSDPDPITGLVKVQLTQSGTNNWTDAGFIEQQFATISDRVWADTNKNGIQDPGENGIGGANVNLYSNNFGAPGLLIDQAQTDPSGLYAFSDITPGSYIVEFEAPAGYGVTLGGQGDDPATDSNADANGLVGPIAIAANEVNDGVDVGFALLPSGSISNLVFEDSDGNGIQGATEVGVANVTVNVYEDNAGNPGALLQTATTSTLGTYVLTDLVDATYHVEFVAPFGRTWTLQDQGADDAIDSDPDPAGVVTVTLGPDEDNDTIDAGLAPPQISSLSDFVWNDSNEDGIQGPGEAGLAGIAVKLWSDDGNAAPDAIVASDTTDADGKYLLDQLAPGIYHVEFVAAANWALTPQDQGADDAADSDPDPATGMAMVTLGPAQDIDTIDAGMSERGSISNYVWLDADYDGIQDPAESGLVGIIVNLYDDDAGAPGSQIGTDTTDASGLYSFDLLSEATYFIEFEPPAGRTWAAKHQGNNGAIDSDVDPVTNFTDAVTVTAGQHVDTIDAGLVPPLVGSLSDRVWHDTNEDGLQSSGEPNGSGVTVNLWSDDGNGAPDAILDTKVTASNGRYLFDEVEAGVYHLEFVAPTGFSWSLQNVGANDQVDSDANPLTGFAGPITLSGGVDDPSIDAGLVPRGSLSDYVWIDLDENGTQDANESGLAGVTVNLWSDDGNGAPDAVIMTDVTDSSGLYSFDVLAPATYHIEFETPPNRFFTSQNVGGDDAVDSDANPATGHTGPIALAPSADNDSVDAGFLPYAPATIGDRVWFDLNGDGIQDADEPGAPGIVVRVWPTDAQGLLPPGVIPVTAVTDDDGNWSLTVDTGHYRVNPTLPVGAIGFSPWNAGNDDIDSDIAPAGHATFGFSDPFEATPGEVQLDVDTGLIVANAIGNLVFDDANENGIQDTSEPGVAGVTVNLLDTNDQVEQTTTTNSDGQYLFYGLTTDTYRIGIDLPADLVLTTADAGGGDALDSDLDPATGVTPDLVIGADTINPNVDAGLIAKPPSGDVSCDGNVDIVDALFISQYTVGTRVHADCPFAPGSGQLYVPEGDINDDGKTDIVDSLMISQCEVGIANAYCSA